MKNIDVDVTVVALSPKTAKIRRMMQSLKADTIREDGRLERHCIHGVGHPVGHIDNWKPHHGVHSCCGCCGAWAERQEY